MNAWRWLVIAACLVLVVAMIAFARGDRQRGETESAAPVLTVVSDRTAVV